MADIVIVSCHIGAEGEGRSAVTRASELFLGEDRGNPYAFAHAAIDAGADVVFCHGPAISRARSKSIAGASSPTASAISGPMAAST